MSWHLCHFVSFLAVAVKISLFPYIGFQQKPLILHNSECTGRHHHQTCCCIHKCEKCNFPCPCWPLPSSCQCVSEGWGVCVCVCLHLRWHRTGVIRGRHAAGRSLEKQCALLPHPPRAGTGRTLLHFIWRLHLWGLSCLLGRLTGLAMSSFPKQGKGCFTWLSGLIISLKWRWWRRVYTPLVSGACVDTACACAVRANVHLIRRVCTL